MQRRVLNYSTQCPPKNLCYWYSFHVDMCVGGKGGLKHTAAENAGGLGRPGWHRASAAVL